MRSSSRDFSSRVRLLSPYMLSENRTPAEKLTTDGACRAGHPFEVIFTGTGELTQIEVPDCRTSVKYHRGNFAELLATFRPELERIANGLDSVESPVKSAGVSQARSRQRPRRARAKPSYQEPSPSLSDENGDGSDGEVANQAYQRDWQGAGNFAHNTSAAAYSDDARM